MLPVKGWPRENVPKARRAHNTRKLVAEKMTELVLPPLAENPQVPDAADTALPFP